MSPKAFVVLSILTVIALGAAVLGPSRTQGPQVQAGAGDKVFPNLIEKANDVATVEIEHAKGKITLINGDKGWTMKERNGYPARKVRVQREILGLAELSRWEPKTRLKEKFAKLELQDLGAKEAKSKRIKVFDSGGNQLADLIVGKRRANLAGTTTGGVYVRKPGDDQTWLAAGTTDISKERMNWLERKIVNIEFFRVKDLSIRHPDGETIKISKPTPKAEDFTLADIPPGKKLSSKSGPNDIGRSLVDLQLDDVQKDQTPFDAAATITADVTTFDGLSLKVFLTKRNHEQWLKIEAAGTEGEGAKKAKAITERTKGWVYKISSYSASSLTKRLKDLVEDAKPKS